MTDHTKNRSGEANMMPLTPLSRDGTTDLFDMFIRDGWMRADDRMEQIAVSYRDQLAASMRNIKRLQDRLEAQSYRMGWIGRVSEYVEHRQ